MKTIIFFSNNLTMKSEIISYYLWTKHILLLKIPAYNGSTYLLVASMFSRNAGNPRFFFFLSKCMYMLILYNAVTEQNERETVLFHLFLFSVFQLLISLMWSLYGHPEQWIFFQFPSCLLQDNIITTQNGYCFIQMKHSFAFWFCLHKNCLQLQLQMLVYSN